MATTTYPSSRYEDVGGSSRIRFLGMPFDKIDQASVLRKLTATKPGDPFRYIVTPNVDHVIRAAKDPRLLRPYERASLSVCDSTPIVRLAKLLGHDLPLVTGSDLTARMCQSVLKTGDCITLIASTQQMVRDLEFAFPQVHFRSYVPPAGVALQEDLVQQCANFIAEQSSRFIFLSIGCPASEMIVERLSLDPRASGTALCVGASFEFILNTKRRAPPWMRSAGLEWLHRLASEPRRLWRRYVYAVVPLAKLFAIEVVLRARA